MAIPASMAIATEIAASSNTLIFIIINALSCRHHYANWRWPYRYRMISIFRIFQSFAEVVAGYRRGVDRNVPQALHHRTMLLNISPAIISPKTTTQNVHDAATWRNMLIAKWRLVRRQKALACASVMTPFSSFLPSAGLAINNRHAIESAGFWDCAHSIARAD